MCLGPCGHVGGLRHTIFSVIGFFVCDHISRWDDAVMTMDQ